MPDIHSTTLLDQLGIIGFLSIPLISLAGLAIFILSIISKWRSSPHWICALICLSSTAIAIGMIYSARSAHSALLNVGLGTAMITDAAFDISSTISALSFYGALALFMIGLALLRILISPFIGSPSKGPL